MELVEAEKEYSSKQKQVRCSLLHFYYAIKVYAVYFKLTHAHEELNKRIYEHDKYGDAKKDLTLPVSQRPIALTLLINMCVNI